MRLTIFVDRLNCHDLQVYSIQGQHDMSHPPWCTVAGAHNIEATEADAWKTKHGPAITGLDYRPRSELLGELANVPSCDVLFLHQMLAEAMPFVGTPEMPAYDVELADIPEHVKLCIMGDLHQPYENPAHKPPVYYTGATHMRSISEPPEHSFIVINDDLSVSRQPLDSRPFKLFQKNLEEDFKKCLDELQAYQPTKDHSAVSKPYVVVRYNRDIEDVSQRLAIAAGDRFYLRKLPMGTVDQMGEETKEVQGSVTLEGCLDELIKSAVPDEHQQQIYDFTRALLSAKDPRATIEEWRKQVMDAQPAGV